MAPREPGQNEEIMRNLRNQRGFTLMELMVVIVIVAILAAVAVPLYINYVKDAKRTEAKGAIAAVISAEQVYFQNEETYLASTDLEADLKLDLTDVEKNWTIEVTSASGTAFTVEATGKNDAAGLYVCCTYDRTAAPVWGEAAGECGGGGGGGP
jgi:type IV pilus assembly protein PilE